ncbi:MAG: aminotransferase class I/II-fold pyridoxal phosphate-dependent enzyme [Acidimicrobiia bacterium]|nr:aminotransferase class I/II-fold pyridoxal phosphate-dependent enzyme [Acidimicrobiia bacterium]NNL46879.1 aminotransferase class I/II-fold pyridoxal phosphate-dependent enzyme [Acidimicrobiia bacterium]
MEFRRVGNLPPYVFAEVDQLKIEARQNGRDIVDLGFGNPDLPSPPAVVEKLIEAAQKPSNHRYSSSRGIPNLRKALADRYQRRFGVTLDPETEVITTIGAKEGLAHLMWTLVQPGDTALVPEPSYPIHIYAPVMAGAEVRRVTLDRDGNFFFRLEAAFNEIIPKPRVIVVSFPHNPTGLCVDLDFFDKLVQLARERDVKIVHDFAYADLVYDDYEPPSILQVPGAKDVAVELYTLTKGHSMAGWRVGFVAGNPEMVAALAKLKSYLDYGTFQPIQIASIIALNEHDHYPGEISAIYKRRRDTLIDGLARAGWEIPRPRGTMFVWAPMPRAFIERGSLEFAKLLLREAGVAVSPGIGFGPSGEGFVRFALVENEQRIGQAVKGIRTVLSDHGTG